MTTTKDWEVKENNPNKTCLRSTLDDVWLKVCANGRAVPSSILREAVANYSTQPLNEGETHLVNYDRLSKISTHSVEPINPEHQPQQDAESSPAWTFTDYLQTAGGVAVAVAMAYLLHKSAPMLIGAFMTGVHDNDNLVVTESHTTTVQEIAGSYNYDDAIYPLNYVPITGAPAV
jgi:hypothetical protein